MELEEGVPQSHSPQQDKHQRGARSRTVRHTGHRSAAPDWRWLSVCDGASREAAQLGCTQRQTPRDWACRFNADGPDGLIDRKPPGRKPKLSAAQVEELRGLVEAGPDPVTDGVVRWRCVDLKRVLSDRSLVDVSRVTLGRVLKKPGFSRISARPRHPAQKPEAIAAFKNAFPSWPPGP